MDNQKPTTSDTLTSPYGNWQLAALPETQHRDKNIYQQFELSLQKDLLSAKAFNHMSVPISNNDKGKIHITASPRTTRMAVWGREQFLENYYFSALIKSSHWKIKGQQLILISAGKKLYFTKQKKSN